MYPRNLKIICVFVFYQVLPAKAIFDSTARTNVAAYYGQGPNQPRLLHFCQQPSIDIIPLAFVDIFPAQGNGFPGTNFGNRCWGGVYSAPGYNGVVNHGLDALQSQCPTLVEDIPICQATYGTKILLSLGGGTHTYQLSGTADGEKFADFLWGAFGPQTSTWLAQKLPRPFDGPNGQAVEVDGFDFDIEFPSTDNSTGYIALITRLRTHISTSSSSSHQKPYLITGAPQCAVPDTNMGPLLTHSGVAFDMLFIQFYNTATCSARTFISSSAASSSPSGFTYDAWTSFLADTPSAAAKLYIGLPGSPAAAVPSHPSFYLQPAEALRLIRAFFCRPNFGGVMLWDATYADRNVVGSAGGGSATWTYYLLVKEYLLLSLKASRALGCAPPPPRHGPVPKAHLT